MNHSDLCKLAVKWLKRPNSAGGHGCQVAVSECKSGWDGEIPDAIGFRTGAGASLTSGSVVVEVKVSRRDFLADRAKPHRQPGAGIGTWRYFMAPAGLIAEHELPERWGLLAVNTRGHVKPVCGPAAAAKNWGDFTDTLKAFQHLSDFDRERSLLVMLLARIEDPEAVNQRIREANNTVQRLIKSLERERRQALEVSNKRWQDEARIRELEQQLAAAKGETP